MKGVQWRWVLALCVVLAGLMYLRDPLLFSLPLLVGLVTFKILFLEEGRLVKSKLAAFYVALLFAPFGLLPLIKGSMLILCGAIATLCAVFFIANLCAKEVGLIMMIIRHIPKAIFNKLELIS
jgi:membrane-bound ClpP family serine protease